MSLTLVSVDEVRQILGDLEIVEVGGIPYVNAAELAAAVGRIVGIPMERRMFPDEGGAALVRPVAPANTAEDALVAALPSPSGASFTLVELEQRRLDLLPPGKCRMCTCPAGIAHEGGRCVDCDCDNYQDSIERDAVASLAAQGVYSASMADIPPAPLGPEPGIDHGSPGRPAARLMSDRFTDG